jgi:large subunit ribosomal protein L24e
MQKVEEARVARQDRFYEKRMQRAREQQKEADKRQLEQEIHLVKAPAALAKDKEAKLKVTVEEEQFEDGMQE